MSKLPEKRIKQPTETKDIAPTPIPKQSPQGQKESTPVPQPVPKPSPEGQRAGPPHPVPIPEPSRRELVDYVIRGKVDTQNLEKLSKEVPIRVYAVRDRKVLGSAPINKKDGTFEIKYKYFTMKQTPYGVNIIVGPALPGDQILKLKLEGTFLSYKGFKKMGEES